MHKVSCLLITAVLFAVAYADSLPEIVWELTWDRSLEGVEHAWDVVVDGQGFIYMVGQTVEGQPSYSWAVKFTPGGEDLWVKKYEPQNWEEYYLASYGVALDTSGYLYATGKWGLSQYGFSIFHDYHLIKYDSTGDTVWSRIWDSDDNDIGTDVAVDETGFVYVTGHFGEQDTTEHGTPVDGPHDFCTIKYDSEGSEEWDKSYGYPDKDEKAFGIATDQDGYIYVTGTAYQNETYGYNYLSIKYDSDGNEIWKSFYRSYDDDWAKAVAVDDEGNVYVTGFSGPEDGPYDYLTIKYDPAGNEVWKRFYDSGYDERGQDITVDAGGSIYVAGWLDRGNQSYRGRLLKYDSEGNLRWETHTRGLLLPYAIAVDDEGYIYVSGYGNVSLIKYRQLLGVEEEPQSLPPTFTVDQSVANTARISYQLAEATHLNLSAYDASGRLVTTLIQGTRTAGKHLAHWTPPSPGVYFIRLDTPQQTVVAKSVMLR